jgi:hypothetical protein
VPYSSHWHLTGDEIGRVAAGVRGYALPQPGLVGGERLHASRTTSQPPFLGRRGAVCGLSSFRCSRNQDILSVRASGIASTLSSGVGFA